MQANHCGAALVELLCAHGVRVVFGLPGGQTAALYDAIDHDERLSHVTVLDERTAYAPRFDGRLYAFDPSTGVAIRRHFSRAS